MGVTAAPPRPTARPQHLVALEEANRIRYARANIKRALANQPGRHDSWKLAAAYLAKPPAEIQTMRVLDLLVACRRLGLRRAQRMLAVVPVLEGKKIGSLTDRQRQVLVLALARCSS